MSNPVQKVSAYLTGHGLEKVSYDALHKLADEHPYFGVIQFLQTKKMRQEDAADYVKQSQKAALYFSDYYLLDANLSQPLEPWNEEVLQKVSEGHVPMNEDDENAIDSKEENISHAEEELAAATGREADATTETFAEETLSREEVIASSTETEATEENNYTQTPGEPDEHEKMFQNIKAMLDANAEEANADVKDAPVPIDPYHTIDYFASQGIKLHLDPNPDDKLGKNLKKFTQWLRHMKKLGPEDAMESMVAAESEAHIQRIADSSNTAKEVVTEAMATVLEKQGKTEKAIELYNKLSFLNPHKSPYFAARIQSLKEHR